MHRLVVGGKIASAAEFWKMSPGQIWWMIEDSLPKQSTMRPKELTELRDMVKRSKAKEKELSDG